MPTRTQLRARLSPAGTLCVLIKDSPQEGWSLKSQLVRSSLHLQWRTYIKGRPELFKTLGMQKEDSKKQTNKTKEQAAGKLLSFYRPMIWNSDTVLAPRTLRLWKKLRSWEQKAWSTKTSAAQGLVTAQLILAHVRDQDELWDTCHVWRNENTLLELSPCCVLCSIWAEILNSLVLLDIYPLKREIFMVWTPMQEFIPFSC